MNEVNEEALDDIRTKVNDVVEEAFDNEILKKDEYEAMRADDKVASRFYATFKGNKIMRLARLPLKDLS
jgi:hypothetical protein